MIQTAIINGNQTAFNGNVQVSQNSSSVWILENGVESIYVVAFDAGEYSWFTIAANIGP